MLRVNSYRMTLLLVTAIFLPARSNCAGQERQASKGAEITKAEQAEKKPIKLPGLIIDFKNHCVDIEATVCLDKGLLELVACTQGSKEHESIVSVAARPMHVHTALLLLGAKNGNPAIRKQIGDKDRRWVDLPPRGDPVNVYFVLPRSKKNPKERPISEFVFFSPDKLKTETQDVKAEGNTKSSEKSTSFPKTFLFAGSQLQENGKGPRQYMAEKSGNLIAIVSFGDELLCLPEVQSHKNGSLMWRIKPDQLPKVGTKILLRLRPVKNTKNKKDNPSPRQPEASSK